MREQDTHAMEEHLKDRLRDYEKSFRALQGENAKLRTALIMADAREAMAVSRLNERETKIERP